MKPIAEWPWRDMASAPRNGSYFAVWTHLDEVREVKWERRGWTVDGQEKGWVMGWHLLASSRLASCFIFMFASADAAYAGQDKFKGWITLGEWLDLDAVVCAEYEANRRRGFYGEDSTACDRGPAR